MYNILICDDNIEYLKYLKSKILICESDIPFNIKEFTNGESLIRYISNKDICCDMVILDVDLPGIDGEQVAISIREKYPNSVIAFCSGVRKPTDNSIKVLPYRYLYKEYRDEKMSQEINDIINKMFENVKIPEVLAHHYHNQIRLNLKDILFIETSKRGSEIHTISKFRDKNKDIDGKILSDKNLDEIYEKIKNYGFEYANSSYIVNLQYIKKITNNDVYLINARKEDEILPISRSKIKAFKKAFTDYVGKKY